MPRLLVRGRPHLACCTCTACQLVLDACLLICFACRDYYVHSMAMTLTKSDAGNAGWALALAG